MAKRSYRSKAAKLVLPNLSRRKVRYILFRIVRGTVDTMDRDLREHADVLQRHFDSALEDKGFIWADFTFGWDVSPNDPFKVIERDLRLWVKEGGSFIGRPPGLGRAAWANHVVAQLLQNAQTPPLPLDPPGFTKQA